MTAKNPPRLMLRWVMQPVQPHHLQLLRAVQPIMPTLYCRHRKRLPMQRLFENGIVAMFEEC